MFRSLLLFRRREKYRILVNLLSQKPQNSLLHPAQGRWRRAPPVTHGWRQTWLSEVSPGFIRLKNAGASQVSCVLRCRFLPLGWSRTFGTSGHSDIEPCALHKSWHSWVFKVLQMLLVPDKRALRFPFLLLPAPSTWHEIYHPWRRAIPLAVKANWVDGVEHIQSHIWFRTICPFMFVGGVPTTLTTSSRFPLRTHMRISELTSSEIKGPRKVFAALPHGEPSHWIMVFPLSRNYLMSTRWFVQYFMPFEENSLC